MSLNHYQLSTQSIQTGSRSFRLASLILNSTEKRGAYLLYYWCRHCDDIVDQAKTPELAREALQNLKHQTEVGLSNKFYSGDTPFSGLYELTSNYGIPKNYFFELLEGFQMDTDHYKIQSTEDLLKYCYHVAGVVGLMMSFILRVRNKTALDQADTLGRAMQLTNIARDVFEDYQIQRIYLPLEWRHSAGLKDNEALFESSNKIKLFGLVERLLTLADNYYEQGRRGIVELPLRAAWSISVASFLYQGIGLKIKKIGPSALDKRTVLSPLEKLSMFTFGTLYFLKSCWIRSLLQLKERLN